MRNAILRNHLNPLGKTKENPVENKVLTGVCQERGNNDNGVVVWRCHSDLGTPVFLGTPVPKSLVFWVSLVGIPKTLKALNTADWGK